MQVATISRPGATISVKLWPLEDAESADRTSASGPKGVVQIVHGMAEHCSRYDDFAIFLNSKGYAVVAHDHRGHGDTVTEDSPLGYFAAESGWDVAVSDLAAVRSYVDAKYPGVPHFMLGHSMGSLMLRDYLGRSGAPMGLGGRVTGDEVYGGEGLAGAIVMGTVVWLGVQADIGVALSALLKKFAPKAEGKLLNTLSFAGFNAKTEKRTEFDWLSRDHAQVDAYIADSKCGFIPTNTFFSDVLSGAKAANADAMYSSTRKDLPILVTSGAEDPAGGAGAVAEVYGKYREAGVSDVRFKTYPGARHEILNEINGAEVYDDIVGWLDAH